VISLEQLKSKLQGKYDAKGAILSIYAGAGGVDAQDWAKMLLRMYERFMREHGFGFKVLSQSFGAEGGIKSATLEARGPYAYGYLKGEKGVHRLVRISPYSQKKLRHTSFALVEVLPVLEDVGEMKIKPEDLRIDTFRATGPGGQYVNKTESAVRFTHLPTGIVVSCQAERSQAQNRERAMKLLKTKLKEIALREKTDQRLAIRGKLPQAEWGSQIRSYVLHPYKMVKDHRTGLKSAEVEKVLDGKIEKFIEAEIGLTHET